MNEIAQIQGLRDPSFSLYAFHLRTDISQGPEQTTAEASQLWEQLVDLGQTLHIPELQGLRQKLICYENGQYQPAAENKLYPNQVTLLPSGEDGIDFQIVTQPGRLELKGFLCPFRVHDTYALDLNLFHKNTIDLVELSQINPQGRLLPQHIRASLGQTLMLYAEPVTPQDNYQALADACVAQLLQGTVLPELVGTGTLLGNPVFEYDNLELDPALQCHILIWLECQSMKPEQVDEVFKRLFYLLCFHHKILYVYHQSRWCDTKAKQLYSTLEQYAKDFKQISQTPTRLQQFKDWLLELPQLAFEYSRYLRDLEDHETTLSINAENYSSQMKKLEGLPDNDLRFLQQFLERVHNKYEKQIQADRSYLEPGRDFSERLINTIQSIVAIDQVESDRQFQQDLQKREQQFQQALAQQERQWQESLRKQDEANQARERNLQLAVAFFGVGFAVSGISSQVNPTPLEAILGKSPPEQSKPVPTSAVVLNVVDVLIHIMIGVLAGLFAIVLVLIWQRKNSNHTS